MMEFIMLLLFALSVCAMIGAVIEGACECTFIEQFGGAADDDGIMSAVTDTGASQTFTAGFKNPPFPSKITATVAATTAAHVKAIQVVIVGTAPGGAVITESLPAFTDNTPGAVTGSYVFETITSITIPAHDGTSASTKIGYAGAPQAANTTGIHAAVTDTGATQTITTAIMQPDVPRNITATAGGTANDIKPIQVTITGTNKEGSVITETLPVFTEDTPGSVAGSKAFKTVTSISIPAHDGNGATTAIGFGEIIGLSRRRKRKTVKATYLAEVLETVAASETFDATALESNTIELNSSLNSTQVKVEYLSAEQ